MTTFLATVIIPIGSVTPDLQEQLAALARQDATFSWELVLAHNWPAFNELSGSVALPQGLRHVRQINASAVKGPSHARNAGAAAARSDLFLFCDADDVVCDGWVSEMVAALGTYDAAGGRVDEKSLNPKTASWRPSSQDDRLPVLFDFLPRTIGANCGVRRTAFHAVGGFDEELFANEDTVFSWRLQLAGYSLGFAEKAVVFYRHRDQLRLMSRQHFGYGRSSPRLSARFAADGFPYSPRRIVFGALSRVVPRPGNWPARLSVGWLVRQGSIACGTLYEWTRMKRESIAARGHRH